MEEQKYKVGQHVFIISNNSFVMEMVIVLISGDFYTLRSVENYGSGMRLGQNMDISYISKTCCRAKVNVQVNNTFFAWIFGFDGKVRISGPKDIKEQYIRMVSREMARL